MATVKIEFQTTPHLLNAVTTFQDPLDFHQRDKYQIQKRYQKEESLGFPKRTHPVRAHRPKIDDVEDEFYLGIYEDDADCPDLTDSEDDLDEADTDDDDDSDNDNVGVVVHRLINKLKGQSITDMNLDLGENCDEPGLIEPARMANGVVNNLENDTNDVTEDAHAPVGVNNGSRVYPDPRMDIEDDNRSDKDTDDSEVRADEHNEFDADDESGLDKNGEKIKEDFDVDAVKEHQEEMAELQDDGATYAVCTPEQKHDIDDVNVDDNDDDDNVAGKEGLIDVNIGDGRRRKVNTPASVFTEVGPSRNASRLESRENVYRQALRLLSNRCKSRNLMSGMDSACGDPFYGVHTPEMMYVDQQKPVPMPPLKAWRGYNGNIYFAPIQVDKCKCPQSEFSFPNEFRTSFQKQPPSPCRSEYMTSKTPLSQQQGEFSPSPKPPRCGSQQSNTANTLSHGNLSESSKSRLSERKMAVLDKRSVINQFNQNIEEDLCWIEGQEHTGTLAVVVPVRNGNRSKGNGPYDKERLYKGSVVHQINTVNYSNNTAMTKISSKHAKTDPFLLIRGDKFAPPTVMSPLLRTQTQYSQSTQRMTNNSPDLHHGGFDKLPPLEQLRASLRFPDHNLPNPYGAMATYSRPKVFHEGYKPFIKYSPELVPRRNQRRILYS